MPDFDLGNQLERQLAAYSAASRNITARTAWRERLGSWPAYCAATAAALAGATSASAGIIHSGPVNLSVSVAASLSGGSSKSVHIAGLPAASFFLHLSHFTSGGPRFGSAGMSFKSVAGYRSLPAPVRRGGVLLSFSHYIANLPPGSVVSNYARFGRRGLFISTASVNTLGASSVVGFAGVKLLAGTAANRTGAGTTHAPLYDLGWLHIKIHFLTGLPDAVTLLDYAYNDVPGAPIQVPGSVPEPATGSMLLLAAGAAGMMAWKRRRTADSTGPQSESAQ